MPRQNSQFSDVSYAYPTPTGGDSASVMSFAVPPPPSYESVNNAMMTPQTASMAAPPAAAPVAAHATSPSTPLAPLLEIPNDVPQYSQPPPAAAQQLQGQDQQLVVAPSSEVVPASRDKQQQLAALKQQHRTLLVEDRMSKIKNVRKNGQMMAATGGAVAGLVVAGPIGAVVGGVVGHQVVKRAGRVQEKRLRTDLERQVKDVADRECGLQVHSGYAV